MTYLSLNKSYIKQIIINITSIMTINIGGATNQLSSPQTPRLAKLIFNKGDINKMTTNILFKKIYSIIFFYFYTLFLSQLEISNPYYCKFA